MIIVTPQATIREGKKLIEELRAHDINSHAKLISDPVLKERVDKFLEDVKTALKKIQKEIRYNIDLPSAAYNPGKVKDLKTQERLLVRVQDDLLSLATERR